MEQLALGRDYRLFKVMVRSCLLAAVSASVVLMWIVSSYGTGIWYSSIKAGLVGSLTARRAEWRRGRGALKYVGC